MRLIVKSKAVAVSSDLKEYIEVKLYPVIKEHSQEPTVCEAMLSDANGPRGGADKLIEISCSVAGVKNPIFVKAKSRDYFQSIDIIEGKLKRALHKSLR